MTRKFIFASGKIPRGRAKSPKSTVPPDNISVEDIQKQLSAARQAAGFLESLDKDQFFKHFSFGMLNREKAERFIVLHTNHHLNIIEDILKK